MRRYVASSPCTQPRTPGPATTEAVRGIITLHPAPNAGMDNTRDGAARAFSEFFKARKRGAAFATPRKNNRFHCWRPVAAWTGQNLSIHRRQQQLAITSPATDAGRLRITYSCCGSLLEPLQQSTRHCSTSINAGTSINALASISACTSTSLTHQSMRTHRSNSVLTPANAGTDCPAHACTACLAARTHHVTIADPDFSNLLTQQ